MSRVCRQALVQMLLARRVMPLADAERVWTRVTHDMGESGALADALTALNAELTHVGLEVRSARDQSRGTPLVVLVNTRGDAIAEGATPYTGSELAFVRALVDAASAPDAFAISTTDALSLAAHPMSKRAATDVLRSLVERGWISERRGAYVLAPRALCELDAYLRSDENALECGALSLIHISEPRRHLRISYAVFCLKKKTARTVAERRKRPVSDETVASNALAASHTFK